MKKIKGVNKIQFSKIYLGQSKWELGQFLKTEGTIGENKVILIV